MNVIANEVKQSPVARGDCFAKYARNDITKRYNLNKTQETYHDPNIYGFNP